ncbi:hypothetical protein [Rubrivirga sp.]|uniref:hypothetical protein n=1 Tax=Rubrivirga sp. TaxID=1885344 RepID=UPI003C725B7F
MSIAAQGYPILVAIAVAVVIPISALFAGKRSGRSWGIWSMSGVGLGVLATVVMLPFVDLVQMDVYLVAAGVAAAGILAGGVPAFLFSSDDDDDQEES